MYQNCACRGPAACGGRCFLILSGAAFAAASEGHLYSFTEVSEIKTFPAVEQRRGLNDGGKTILQVSCFWIAVSLSSLFADLCG